MLNTVEAVHCKFLYKLENITLAAGFLQDISKYVDRSVEENCKQLLVDAEALSSDYNLATVSILSEYYKTNAHNEDINTFHRAVMRLLCAKKCS
jgi:hypothetical protein